MAVLKILQNALIKNFQVKLFSLLIAFFLWLYVVTDNYFIYKVKIPLILSNKPQNKVLLNPVPSDVSIEVKGTGKDILRFLYANKKIVINIKNLENSAQYRLSVDMIKGIPENSGIRPIRIINPKKINVQVDEFFVKKVPVVPDIHLKPMDGYIQVGDVCLEPDSIIISGPRSKVKSLKMVVTDSVFYSKIIKDFKGEVELINPDKGAIEISRKKVKYKAKFQRIGERIFTRIPVEVINVPKGISVIVVPSTMTLRLQAGVEVLSKIDKSMIKATIDFRSRNRYPNKKLSAVIELPDNIITYEAKPQFFEIIVE
ncbi:hypothetical protein DRQ07_06910 [candidate division KSB1 bacterium]|nr:MAG: hypothetical protein DRQ07_06910 [candidate division KSB1 bacterium]